MVVHRIEDPTMVVQFHLGPPKGLLGERLTHCTVYAGITSSNLVQIAKELYSWTSGLSHQAWNAWGPKRARGFESHRVWNLHHTESRIRMSVKYIRDTYNVPCKRGARVRYTWNRKHHEGVITSARGRYIYIRFDGERKTYPAPFHPTWELVYL